MPGMDGLAVLREAKAQGITTPALFLTAKAEIEDRVTGLDAGTDDYLPKPFDASEMEVIWTYIVFLRKKLQQIGADIELKNHPVAAFHHACRRGWESSSGVCAGRAPATNSKPR